LERSQRETSSILFPIFHPIFTFMRIFFSIIIFSLSCITFLSGSNAQLIKSDSTSLPKVFILGQYEKAYEKLFDDHSTVLLEICDDDMDLAFDKWLSMLEEMEAYATSIDYNIKGIKIWLNVFWNKDGSIKHLAYHLKVNSRNIEHQEELTAFFSSFMNHYKFPLVADRSFSHYGSASFPTFTRRTKTPDGTGHSKKKQNTTKDSVKPKKY